MGRVAVYKLGARPNEARKIAIEATRSYLRRMGIDPATVDEDGAGSALDDLGRLADGTIASNFARFASVSQLKRFYADWRKWLKECKRCRDTSGNTRDTQTNQ